MRSRADAMSMNTVISEMQLLTILASTSDTTECLLVRLH